MNESNYRIAESIDDIKTYVSSMDAKGWGFDTETTGVDARKDRVVGISISPSRGHGMYIPFSHKDTNNLDINETIPVLKEIFSGKIFCMHNSGFDCSILLKYGWNIWDTNKVHDSMVLAYVLGEYSSVGLKSLTKEVFNHEMDTLDSLFSGGEIAMEFISAEEVLEYACEDADWTRELVVTLLRKISDSKTKEIYSYEMKLVPVAKEMEFNGIRVDVPSLNKISKELEEKISYCENLVFDQVEQAAGVRYNFNIGSTADVGDVLFQKMGLPVEKKTKTGKPSTSADVLEKLAVKYPVVQNIITYRRLVKLKSSFVDLLPTFVEEDGKIHTNFLQCHVPTGRFASNQPNLQNIPKVGRNPYITIHADGSEERIEFNIRKAFIPDDGYYFVDADYSQIELKILAGEANEFSLIKAFNNNDDVHSLVASEMYGVSLKDVDKQMRFEGKTINYRLIYGGTAKGLAGQLRIDVNRAKELISLYEESRPSIGIYKEKVISDARRTGLVYTKYGRRRYIPQYPKAVQSQDRKERMMLFAAGDRGAVNSVIQGTAADILKIKMSDSRKLLHDTFGDKVKLLLTVHDEILFMVKNEISLKEICPIIRKGMDMEIEGYPYIGVDIESGDSWGSLEKIEGEGEEKEEKEACAGCQEPLEASEGREKEEKKGAVTLNVNLDSNVFDREKITNFFGYLKGNSGPNKIVVIKSNGTSTELDFTTGVGIDEKDKLEMMIPCTVTVDASSVVGRI